jgi:formiminotetrahydrofolate cyclodeaminase
VFEEVIFSSNIIKTPQETEQKKEEEKEKLQESLQIKGKLIF